MDDVKKLIHDKLSSVLPKKTVDSMVKYILNQKGGVISPPLRTFLKLERQKALSELKKKLDKEMLENEKLEQRKLQEKRKAELELQHKIDVKKRMEEEREKAKKVLEEKLSRFKENKDSLPTFRNKTKIEFKLS